MSVDIPILMYHQIVPDPPASFRKYCVTPRAFAMQMRMLAILGYQTISLDDLFAARTVSGALPPRPIVITFDDGYCASIEYAVPVLRAHAFTATFFLVAGLLGAASRWLHAPIPHFPLIDATTARWLAANAFACGSHTCSHPRLPTLATPTDELARSRALLEDRLGMPVRHLAYPYGAFDARTIAAAATTGYLTACTTVIGRSQPSEALLALRRIPVNGTEHLGGFLSRLGVGYPAGDAAAAMIGALRRRVTDR